MELAAGQHARQSVVLGDLPEGQLLVLLEQLDLVDHQLVVDHEQRRELGVVELVLIHLFPDQALHFGPDRVRVEPRLLLFLQPHDRVDQLVRPVQDHQLRRQRLPRRQRGPHVEQRQSVVVHDQQPVEIRPRDGQIDDVGRLPLRVFELGSGHAQGPQLQLQRRLGVGREDLGRVVELQVLGREDVRNEQAVLGAQEEQLQLVDALGEDLELVDRDG